MTYAVLHNMVIIGPHVTCLSVAGVAHLCMHTKRCSAVYSIYIYIHVQQNLVHDFLLWPANLWIAWRHIMLLKSTVKLHLIISPIPPNRLLSVSIEINLGALRQTFMPQRQKWLD